MGEDRFTCPSDWWSCCMKFTKKMKWTQNTLPEASQNHFCSVENDLLCKSPHDLILDSDIFWHQIRIPGNPAGWFTHDEAFHLQKPETLTPALRGVATFSFQKKTKTQRWFQIRRTAKAQKKERSSSMNVHVFLGVLLSHENSTWKMDGCKIINFLLGFFVLAGAMLLSGFQRVFY